MIIQFHTPKGIVDIDSKTVTDEKLAEINITRDDLNFHLASCNRDVLKELDAFETRLKKLEGDAR